MAIGIIRRHSKTFIWIVLFFVIITFAFFGTIGMMKQGCEQGRLENAATYKDGKISRSDFDYFKQRWLKFARVMNVKNEVDYMSYDPAESIKYHQQDGFYRQYITYMLKQGKPLPKGVNLAPPPKPSQWHKEMFADFWADIFAEIEKENKSASGDDPDEENKDNKEKKEDKSKEDIKKEVVFWRLYILLKEAEKAGIQVSDEEMVRKFPNEGTFNKVALVMESRVSKEGASESRASADGRRVTLKTVREFALINRLVWEIGLSYNVSFDELTEYYHKQNDLYAFKYIAFDEDKYAGKIKSELSNPDKKEELGKLVTDFYNKKINEPESKDGKPDDPDYWTEPSVKIVICEIPYYFNEIRNSIPAKDYAVTDEEIKKEFADNRDEYFEYIPAKKDKKNDPEKKKEDPKKPDDKAKDPKDTKEPAKPEQFKPQDSEVPVPETMQKKRYLSFDEAKSKIRTKLEDKKKDVIETAEKQKIL